MIGRTRFCKKIGRGRLIRYLTAKTPLIYRVNNSINRAVFVDLRGISCDQSGVLGQNVARATI